MSKFVEWWALVDVLVVGLVIGAGLPALFAVGVRALAGAGSRDETGRWSRIRIVEGIACFAVVVGAITVAIVYIVTGGH